MSREQTLSVIYDLAMVVGGEVQLAPLLTKTLQRLMYHTSFPCAMVFLELDRGGDGEITQAPLQAALGDFELAAHVGEALPLPRALIFGLAGEGEVGTLVDTLPCRRDYYRYYLRLPVADCGVILLLSPGLPQTDVPLHRLFMPVMNNLARSIILCRRNEEYQRGIIGERDAARIDLGRFRAAMDTSSDCVFLIDGDSARFIDFNRSAERELGIGREELLGLGLPDVVVPDQREAVEALVRGVLTERKGSEADTWLARRGGLAFPAAIRFSLLDSGGLAPIVIAVARDITERQRTLRALHRAVRTHRTLSACNTALVHAEEESRLLQDNCDNIVRVGGYAMAWIAYAEAENRVRPMAHAGMDAAAVATLPTGPAKPGQRPCPVCRALARDVPLVHRPGHDALGATPYAAMVALPFHTNGGRGALNIYSTDPESFDEEEVRFLNELAGDIGFGIRTLHTRAERDQVIAERTRYIERIGRSMEDTVQAIAAIVEMRDPYTAGHQRRVAALATAIAKEMGWETDRIEGLRVAAEMHDLGKVRISAEILSKPARLTELEFRFIATHPQTGYEILSGIDFPWPVAEAILQHHERLDGSGYPHGLEGEAIIPEARVIAVADVVEAMASHRPYRAALGLDAALTEVDKFRNERYDPAVVDACVRVFRERGFSLD